MPLERAQSLWDFAVSLYGHAQVKSCCLSLQARADIDVCVLLAVAWLASRGRLLDSAELQSLLAVASPWRQQLVLPIRALRNTLRPSNESPQSQQTPVPHSDIEAMYAQLKNLELDAERRQLTQMQQWLENHLLQPARSGPAHASALASGDCIDANIQCYLSRFAVLKTDTVCETAALFRQYVN